MVVRRILWLALALILAVGVPFLAFGMQTGLCVDSRVPGQSYCTMEPSIGWPAAVLASLAALVAAGFAVRRSAREP